MRRRRDLIDEAWAARSAVELQLRTFDQLRSFAPFDAASFIPLSPVAGPPVRTVGGEERYFRLFKQNQARYANSMTKARAASSRWGAYVDTEVFTARERDRLPFFVELMKPRNITSRLVAYVSFRQRLLGSIHLCRYGAARPFRHQELAGVSRLLPTIGLINAAHAYARVTPAASRTPSLERLSPREREVALNIGRGLGNKEIATQLGSSVSTVRKQTMSIFDKLQLTGRLQLALLVQTAGLLNSDDD